jgi:mannose-6-phosphate isomerase-like protein (cupin superfamily)
MKASTDRGLRDADFEAIPIEAQFNIVARGDRSGFSGGHPLRRAPSGSSRGETKGRPKHGVGHLGVGRPPPRPVASRARHGLRLSSLIVDESNGQHIKPVQFQGEFVRRKHAEENQLFLVITGRFRIKYRDRHAWLEEGEFLILPRVLEHRQVVEPKVHVLLFEPAETPNNGEVKEDRTVQEPERI